MGEYYPGAMASETLEARLNDVFPFALIAVHRKAPVSAVLRHLVPDASPNLQETYPQRGEP